MSAGCIKCGDCCDPVLFGQRKMDRAYLTAICILVLDGDRERKMAWWKDFDFIVQHWHPLNSTYSQCDKFDPKSRTCTAYDERPPVCSRYPWYGEPPALRSKLGLLDLPKTCTYWADLPPRERPADWVPLRNALGMQLA